MKNKYMALIIMCILYICFPLMSNGEDSKMYKLLSIFYESGYILPADIDECDLYCMDDVLFGGKTLLLYPKWITSTCYTIPDGVEDVFDYAFYGNEHIESGTIPSSCRTLGYYSFGDCYSLREVDFIKESQVLIIDDYCFSGCHSLTQFEFPQSLYAIGDEAFAETSITEIDLPSTLRLIGDYAFIRTHISRIIFDPAARPKYVGHEWITLSSNDSVTIVLPFDADINHFFENSPSLIQMNNIELLYAEEP